MERLSSVLDGPHRHRARSRVVAETVLVIAALAVTALGTAAFAVLVR